MLHKSLVHLLTIVFVLVFYIPLSVPSEYTILQIMFSDIENFANAKKEIPCLSKACNHEMGELFLLLNGIFSLLFC